MTMAQPREIVVEQQFPHEAAVIWKVLTDGELMARWLMRPEGFAPEPGRRFTFRTTPAGAWDGTIACEVLEVVPDRRLAFRWQGGHEGNSGYGSRLDTVVTFTLTPVAGGTSLRLVHAGFELPRNEHAFRTMGEGWSKVVPRLGEIAGGGEEGESR